jgi:hypothetical protein
MTHMDYFGRTLLPLFTNCREEVFSENKEGKHIEGQKCLALYMLSCTRLG